MAVKNSKTYYAIPPGESIKEALDIRDMTQKEFAARMGMSEKHISKLVNGEVLLTHETAVRLEMVLGVDAGFWERLEAMYREDILKVEAENAMEQEIEVAKKLPYAQMAKLGWLPRADKQEERVVNLRKYFELVDITLLAQKQITRIACHELQVTDKADLSLIAWAQKAKLIAREQKTEKLDSKGLSADVPTILSMKNRPLEGCIDEVEDILAARGVVLVTLPPLSRLAVKGATFLDGKKAVVVMPEGALATPEAWHSLFHELGHIVLGQLKSQSGITTAQEAAVEEWVATL